MSQAEFPVRGVTPWDETLKTYIDEGDSGGGAILPWATATAYILGQPVTNSGHVYLATDAHTSGATFSGDLGSHWALLPVTKADVGLGNVDNTSDANKPVSTATVTALGTKSDSSHVHVASSVTATAGHGLESTNVQAALFELKDYGDEQLSQEAQSRLNQIDTLGDLVSSQGEDISAHDTRLTTVETEQLAAGRRLISVMVPGVLGGEGLQSFNHAVDGGVPNFDCAERGIIVVPEKTKRWRVRIANRSAIYNEAVDGAGTIDVAGVWMGSPATAESRWTGAFASTPTKVVATAPAAVVDITEWVSPWVEGSGNQLGPWQTVLSLGIRAVSTLHCYYDDERGFSWIGPGAAAGAGAIGAPGGATRFDFTSLDVRIEYEVETTLPLVWVFGDSIASGYSPTPNIQQFETWPAQAAVGRRFQATNFGVSSAFSAHFSDATRTVWQWARMNVGSQIPDIAIISLGTNDIGIGQPADNVSGRWFTLIQQLRSAGVPRILGTTLVPMEFANTDPDVETERQIQNQRVRNHWWSIAGIIDFDKVMRAEYDSASSTADLMDSANAHPTVAGYEAMAKAVRL